MNSLGPSVPPAGWYPDPAGSRQWRVWTGTQWSELTKPYGDAPLAPSVAASLPLIQAVARTSTAGVVGVLGGLGLLVGALSHWPTSTRPTPLYFAATALVIAIGALIMGTVVCSFAVTQLRGRWGIDAVIPGVNLFVASSLVARRLGRRQALRLCAEIALLVLFVFSSHGELWLDVGPAVVAFVECTWFNALVDVLTH